VSAVLQQGCVFGAISGGTFLLLGLAFYALYGHEFLHEAYLHHTIRKDPRHNFSVYYYPIYLDFMPWPAQLQAPAAAAAAGVAASDMAGSHLMQQILAALPRVNVDRLAAVPQLALLLVLAVSLHRDLPLCLLMQTWAFVAFNKVSTAQYFVWYLSLLPAALQKVPWPLPPRLRAAAAAWVVTQLHWLLWGYLLEFEGRGVHLGLWTAGVLFLAANAFCMVALMESCGSESPTRPTKATRAKLRHGAVKEQ
jgi:phosphatidylinositol glycan class M